MSDAVGGAAQDAASTLINPLHIHPNIRRHCEQALGDMLSFSQPASTVLSNYLREFRELGARDRAVIAETVYAALRRLNLYRNLAQSGVGPMNARITLAAIADVAGIAGALKVANPPEQEWLKAMQQVDRTTLPVELQTGLPEWLWQAIEQSWGEHAQALAMSLLDGAPMDIRANSFKTTRDKALESLNAGGVVRYEATSMSPDGIRVQGKPNISKLPQFENGEIEVQDEGSQLLAHLVAPTRGQMVVDLCAGAGGKTLALGALMRSTGRLYACDTSEKRLARFKPRMARSGLSNVTTLAIAHENDQRIKRLAGKIDCVLVDAPCSGSGTLRRNPDMKWRYSPQDVQELQVKQAAILKAASNLLKPGGVLVYATCSLLQAENEAVADAFLKDNPAFAVQDAYEFLASRKIQVPRLIQTPYLRLAPHVHQTDGFFAARFVKQA